MIVYVVKKQKYYFQSWLHIGLKNHIQFADILNAKYYTNKSEAEKMAEALNSTKTWLDVYKGIFKVKILEIKEI